jgi:hypothetical protein
LLGSSLASYSNPIDEAMFLRNVGDIPICNGLHSHRRDNLMSSTALFRIGSSNHRLQTSASPTCTFLSYAYSIPNEGKTRPLCVLCSPKTVSLTAALGILDLNVCPN